MILMGIPWRTRSLSLCSRLMRGVIISLCLLLLWCHDLTTTIGGGPMIGIDRIISTTKHQTVVFWIGGQDPQGSEDTKLHEHQTVVFQIGGLETTNLSVLRLMLRILLIRLVGMLDLMV